MSSKKEGKKVLKRQSSRERKPRGPQDYEQISAAGGMGGGSQGSKGTPKKEPSDQDLLPTVYKSAGIGDSSEPACFFVFNGANGPVRADSITGIEAKRAQGGQSRPVQ